MHGDIPGQDPTPVGEASRLAVPAAVIELARLLAREAARAWLAAHGKEGEYHDDEDD